MSLQRTLSVTGRFAAQTACGLGFVPLATVLIVTCLLVGCGGDKSAPAEAHSHKHHHEPPHGGTGIELGEEEGHLELVLDSTTGKMQAFFLSAHMEDFVRMSAESFEIATTTEGKKETLVFKAVANTATGEKVGDTSQFEVQADWLKSTKSFDGVLKEVTFKGKTYKDVKFNFPKGNE